MGLEQREDMRRRDLAATGYLGEGDPALPAQIGKSCDTAAGARVVGRANDLKPFGQKQFVIEIV